MTADFFKSFGQQIACHKALATGAVCVAVSTGLWAASDLPQARHGTRLWPGSGQPAETSAMAPKPTAKAADARTPPISRRPWTTR